MALGPTPASEHDAKPRRSHGFAGRLGDITLPIILQFVALSRKTGRLTLTRADGQGRIHFRQGRVVHAVSPTHRYNIGDVLIQRGLLTQAEVMEAIETQHLCLEPEPLTQVLVRMGLADLRTLQAVAGELVGRALAELVAWGPCFFRFELMESADLGVDVDGRDFMFDSGLAVENLLVSALGPELARGPEPPLDPEITDTLMRFASGFVTRGALLRVEDEQLACRAQFDREGVRVLESGVAEHWSVPRSESSVCSEAIETGETYRGPLDHLPGNERLLRELGTGQPVEGIVVPMWVGGRVAMVFYGDNGPATRLGAIEPLLMVVAEAAREMDSR